MAGFRPLPCAKDTGKSCAWQGRWSQMNTELTVMVVRIGKKPNLNGMNMRERLWIAEKAVAYKNRYPKTVEDVNLL